MKSLNWFRLLTITGMAFLLVGCRSTAHQDPSPAATEGRAIPAATIQHGPTLADLTGGDLGIGGGFLIGASPDKISGHQRTEAVAAAQRAEQSPAQVQQVRDATTADLNKDGYVTLDEVLAMVRAGLTPAEVAKRLTDTHYLFHMTPEQQRYLTDRGVKPEVISAIADLQKNGPAAVVSVPDAR